VAVKIKLKRLGKIRAPYYRIVVADARTKRDGRAIEEIGKYHPKAEPSFIEVKSDRAQHWLSVGAQPTDPVRKILEITGDWQKFKGLPGAEGTLRTAAPKEDRKEVFAAAVKETLGDAAAAPKGRGKSAGAKDAAPSKTEKPARAKDKAKGGEAKGGEAKEATADAGAAAAKASQAKASQAEASQAEATKAEGSKAEATKAEGSKAEGTKAEGSKAEATKAEGSKAEGGKAEGTKAEGSKADDSKAEADPAVAADADSASRD
jgi:small subunit ribosomal protein S16